MVISGIEKLTLTDYPGLLAAIIFTQGCNFKCPFCQNSDLIACKKEGLIDEIEVLEYLKKRKNMLDGVVISGGEPFLQKDLKTFIRKIKELNLKVKIDTNGSNPEKLKELINENLVDYVAMDVKNDKQLYFQTAGLQDFNLEKIKQSIDLLKSANIDYEFRTTIVKEYHDYNNIINICEYLGDVPYYLQNYEDSPRVLVNGLHGFSKKELIDLKSKINRKFPNVVLRGIDLYEGGKENV